MKYILLGAIVIICGYIGYGISKYYTSRVKFFRAIIAFAESLDTSINFGKEKILCILEKFKSESKEFEALLSAYKKSLINEETVFETFLNTSKFIKEDEKHLLKCFFAELGKLDVFNQTKQIENGKSKFAEFLRNSEEEKKKYGTLYLKLGIIFGTLIALLLF